MDDVAAPTQPAPAGAAAPSAQPPETDAFALNEVQLLLSEMRTALSLMRTGIAVIALPLSVLSVLVATSRYYDALNVLGLLLPLALLCVVLMLFGGYLIVHAWIKIRRIDRLIRRIKLAHGAIAQFMEEID